MKKSMFVYYTLTEDGCLVMMNTYQGTSSIFKVNNDKKEKVLNWLNGDLEEVDEDFYKLKEYGYFIDDEVDEKLLRDLSYSKSRMDATLHLVIHVTTRCNFRCTYCVKRNNISYNMSLPIWRAIFLPCPKKTYFAGFAAMQ